MNMVHYGYGFVMISNDLLFVYEREYDTCGSSQIIYRRHGSHIDEYERFLALLNLRSIEVRAMMAESVHDCFVLTLIKLSTLAAMVFFKSPHVY